MWCIAAAVLGGRDQADDVVQEAAAVALRKLNEFSASTSFEAWLGQIVRFTALNHKRRQVRERGTAVDPLALDRSRKASGQPARPPISSSGRLVTDQLSFDDAVSRALGLLDEVPRACLLLRVLLDMPYREIARIMAIPEGTAMSHVHRSRHQMRTLLAETPVEQHRPQPQPQTRSEHLPRPESAPTLRPPALSPRPGAAGGPAHA